MPEVLEKVSGRVVQRSGWFRTNTKVIGGVYLWQFRVAPSHGG